MTVPQTAMVFAAGIGTRMRPLTETRPKPLIKVAGKPLIEHAFDVLREARVPRAVVNTHYLADQMADYLKGSVDPAVQIAHEPVLLETGGGIKAAEKLLGTEPILAMNADVVWRGSGVISRLAAAWDAERMDALLLLVPREAAIGHRGRGDFDLDASGRLVRRGNAPLASYVYASVQILKPEPVYGWPETAFSLNAVWDQLLAKGRCWGVVFEGQWCDVGYPEALPLAEEVLA